MNGPKIKRFLIDSLLDTDLYKITMLQAFYHAPEFDNVSAEWKFACRNLVGFDLAALIPEIRRQLDQLCTLSFTADELQYLAGLPFLSGDFLLYLGSYRLKAEYVQLQAKGRDLDLRIGGPLIEVALFEIYLLAIISELHTALHCRGFSRQTGRERLKSKIELLRAQGEMPGFRFIDFGTRRRAAKGWQEEVLATLKREVPHAFVGTSSLHFARTFSLQPVGTMASFVRDFSALSCASSYTGLRHDSGCPFTWGEKAIAMYRRMGVDPLTRTLVFSDGLTFPKMIELYRAFQGRAGLLFGLGTNLTNDVGNLPLDIVIKMVAAGGRPVAKISDEPGKSMCEDLAYLQRLATTYGIDPATVEVAGPSS
jgi:nicotinate phosphoribosyltransferase